MKKTMMGCFLLLLATAAFAGEGAAASKFRQLDALAGTWQCSGTAFASPMAPQHATSGVATMKWDFDGHWLPFTYAEKKTAENPMPFRVSGFWGYDAETGQLVMNGVDNMGGYSAAASDGWNGDSLVFTGPWHMGTQTMTGRDTFTRKGDRAMMHMSEVQQDGKWVKLGEESCTKK